MFGKSEALITKMCEKLCEWGSVKSGLVLEKLVVDNNAIFVNEVHFHQATLHL